MTYGWPYVNTSMYPVHHILVFLPIPTPKLHSPSEDFLDLVLWATSVTRSKEEPYTERRESLSGGQYQTVLGLLDNCAPYAMLLESRGAFVRLRGAVVILLERGSDHATLFKGTILFDSAF